MLKPVMGVQKFHLSRCIVRIVSSLMLASLLLFCVAPTTWASSRAASLVGPKKYYLALGDSLAFGYQPDLNFTHGYADDFYGNLKSRGVQSLANMACPDESSNTLINGGCPYPFLRKYPYVGAQLNAALLYLAALRGQVSPVTLDIGSNDVLSDIDKSTCTINASKFTADLATLDSNLTQIILPKLHNALVVNGKVTGDLVMMNYYDPYQNLCPNTVPYVQMVNQHLATDVSKYGIIVDVFKSFGGATVPDAHICTYTWICSIFKDIHPQTSGYGVIATTFEADTGY